MANLLGGWILIACGLAVGALIGCFFHDERWLGGYAAHPRRLVRLGHIALIQLGMLNVLYAVTLWEKPAVASDAWLAGGCLMPLACAACAWRRRWWPVFCAPVTLLLVAAALTIWEVAS